MPEKLTLGPRVLIVSNQQTTGPLWVFSLQQQNLHVVLESDPSKTLQRCEMETPDMIIMDINLPKIDGIAATRFIKTTYPDIAIIGLSLHVQSYSEYAMRKAGAFEVLMKESAVHELYGAIQRAVASLNPILILEDDTSSKQTAMPEEDASSSPDVLAEDSDTPQSSTPPTAC